MSKKKWKPIRWTEDNKPVIVPPDDERGFDPEAADNWKRKARIKKQIVAKLEAASHGCVLYPDDPASHGAKSFVRFGASVNEKGRGFFFMGKPAKVHEEYGATTDTVAYGIPLALAAGLVVPAIFADRHGFLLVTEETRDMMPEERYQEATRAFDTAREQPVASRLYNATTGRTERERPDPAPTIGMHAQAVQRLIGMGRLAFVAEYATKHYKGRAELARMISVGEVDPVTLVAEIEQHGAPDLLDRFREHMSREGVTI